MAVVLYDINTAILRRGIPTAALPDECNAYNPLNRQQRLTLTLTLTRMLNMHTRYWHPEGGVLTRRVGV